MNGDVIALIIIAWVVIAGITIAAVADDPPPDDALAIIAFWPVAVPVLLVFVFFYAIYSSFRRGIRMFRK